MLADLCLVLLLDASGSVDAAEWKMQADATAAALASPAIVEKIVSGEHRNIVVTALEWATAAAEILPWTRIANLDDAQAFAAGMMAYQRKQSESTAVGDALIAASDALERAPACARQVVDISSDGASNVGADPRVAVALLQARGAQVNAIVIEDEYRVLEFYEERVNGFVLPATWENYAQAIKLKLSLDIAAMPPVQRWVRGAPWPSDHLPPTPVWREGFMPLVATQPAGAVPVDEPPAAALFGLALLGLGYLVRGRAK